MAELTKGSPGTAWWTAALGRGLRHAQVLCSSSLQDSSNAGQEASLDLSYAYLTRDEREKTLLKFASRTSRCFPSMVMLPLQSWH